MTDHEMFGKGDSILMHFSVKSYSTSILYIVFMEFICESHALATLTSESHAHLMTALAFRGLGG